MPTRLYNLKISEISGVDRPATRRKFLIIKGEGGSDDQVVNHTMPLTTDEQIEKFARDHYDGSVEKALRENTISVGARNIP